MNTECLDVFAVARTAIEEKVVHLRMNLLGIGIAHTGMNGGPAENSFHGSLGAMNDYSLSRCNLMIHATVPLQVHEPLRIYIIHEPADLIGVCFNNYPEFSIR